MRDVNVRNVNVIERVLMHALFVHLHHNIDQVIDFGKIEELNKAIGELFPGALLVGPGDDAGVIEIPRTSVWSYRDEIPRTSVRLVGKMESHCSPCVVDPWGSAFTGGGGAIRDVVAMGARPLCLMDFVGLGPLDEKVLVGPCGFTGTCTCGNCRLMTNLERLDLISKGIRDVCKVMDVFLLGGGLSTSLGGVVPAVVAAVIGQLVAREPLTKPFKNPGDKIILIGETDNDGNDTVFRAGLAKEMKPAKPLFAEERASMEAALAVIKLGTACSLSDLGAAGIGAAVCESARYGGLGAEVELWKVRAREGKNLTPAELILNETQARYLCSVPSQKVQDVLDRIGENGIASVIGEVNSDNQTIFKHDGKVVAVIPNEPSKEILDFLEK